MFKGAILFQSPVVVEPIDVTGCGETKGCYRNPEDCDPLECDFLLTWMVQETTVLFEMSTTVFESDQSQWVAVGLSENQQMVY